MARIVSTLAGVAAIALAASAGTAAAECFGAHKDVTASVSQPQEGPAVSTYDGQPASASERPAEEAKLAQAPRTSGDATAEKDKK
jgi:hypothetical protein